MSIAAIGKSFAKLGNKLSKCVYLFLERTHAHLDVPALARLLRQNSNQAAENFALL